MIVNYRLSTRNNSNTELLSKADSNAYVTTTDQTSAYNTA